ncbi:MAG: hypothetical protein ACMUHU_04730 [Thermoplasmatota archaeon]
MRRGAILLLLMFLITAGVAMFVTEKASASGSQAATFDHVEMIVDPSIQGYGGEMTVTLTCYFYGGCCYSLFANDIVPGLEVPEGLSIKDGATPGSKSSLTAVAGGEPTLVTFKWVLSCDAQGTYDINASVDTSDCGSRETSYLVHVIKGATITRPEMYPEEPTSDKGISLSFSSSYPVGDMKVVSARVVYWVSDENYDTRDLRFEGAGLVLGNETLQDMEAGSAEADLDEVTSGVFHADIPKSQGPYVYYSIEVVDEVGEITRSSVYRLEVENVSEIERWNLISVLFLTASMIIVVSVLYFGQNILKRRMEGVESRDRFSVLGPVGRKRFLTDNENVDLKKVPEAKWKYIMVGSVVLVCTAVSVYLIISGDAATLIEHFLEGK